MAGATGNTRSAVSGLSQFTKAGMFMVLLVLKRLNCYFVWKRTENIGKYPWDSRTLFSLQQCVSFSGLPTCWGEVLVLIYQAGFEVYNFLQGILPLPLFILCSSGVSASLFMHPIPRNSFLIHLHPHHSWKHNHLLSPGRGPHGPSGMKYFLPLDSQHSGGTTSSSDWEVTALPGQPATSAVLMQGKKSGKSQVQEWELF